MESVFSNAANFYSQFDFQSSYDTWKSKEDYKNAIFNSEDFDYFYNRGANLENPDFQDSDLSTPWGYDPSDNNIACQVVLSTFLLYAKKLFYCVF